MGNPTIGTLEKLADGLSVNLHQVLNLKHELQGEKLLRRRIDQIIDKCDEKELQMILKVISAIKD